MARRDYVPLFSSINTSEKLADLPDDESRLFYLLLLAQCDSRGRCTGRERALSALVWPLLGKSPEAVGSALAACARLGLIDVHGEAGGSRWLVIPDWEEKAGRLGHPDRRGKSRYPEPSPITLISPDSIQTAPDNSGPTPLLSSPLQDSRTGGPSGPAAGPSQDSGDRSGVHRPRPETPDAGQPTGPVGRSAVPIPEDSRPNTCPECRNYPGNETETEILEPCPNHPEEALLSCSRPICRNCRAVRGEWHQHRPMAGCVSCLLAGCEPEEQPEGPAELRLVPGGEPPC